MHVEEIIEHIYIYIYIQTTLLLILSTWHSQRPYLEMMFTSETFPFYVFTNHHCHLQFADFSIAKLQEACRERWLFKPTLNTQIPQYLKKNMCIIFWRTFCNLPSNKTTRHLLKQPTSSNILQEAGIIAISE